MLLPRLAVSIFSLGLAVHAGVGATQDYPNKTVRIVTSPIGGGNDFGARLIAQGISGPLGQSVVVDNRPTVLIGEVVAKSPADGYTLLVGGANFTTGPLLQKTPYDVEKDFAPVVMIGVAPNVLVVHPSLPLKSVKELIALAKARPGELNYARGGPGGSPHLSAELFKIKAGVNIVPVAYKGTGPALVALLGGETQLMFPNAPSAAPYMKSGRLRALGVTSLQPSALVPGLPPIAASGLPGYEATSMDSVYVPAKTLASIINRLNQEIVRFLRTPEAKEKFFNVGIEVVASTPAELAAAVKTEISVMGKVIKDANIRGE